MSKVYITQEPKPNGAGWAPSMAPAAEYGALHFVFGKNDQPFMNIEESIERAKDELRNFNPDEDFICWPNSGDPAALWTIIMVLVDAGYPDLTFLYWNRHKDESGAVLKGKGYYQPLRINVSSGELNFNR